MATVLLPRSLLTLFPGVERRHELAGGTVDALISALDVLNDRERRYLFTPKPYKLDTIVTLLRS